MSFHSWLQSLRSALAPGRGQRQHRRRGSQRAATYRPNLEVLEDRCLLSFSAPVGYAPDTNPIERVWWRLHESVTRNHQCRTMKELLDLTFDWFESRTHFRVRSSMYCETQGK